MAADENVNVINFDNEEDKRSQVETGGKREGNILI